MKLSGSPWRLPHQLLHWLTPSRFLTSRTYGLAQGNESGAGLPPLLLYLSTLVFSVVNLVSQAAVLYAALKSLALGRDFDSADPTAGFVFAGLIYVLIAVTLDVSLRYILSWDAGTDKKRITLIHGARVDAKTSTETKRSATGLGWPSSDYTGTKNKGYTQRFSQRFSVVMTLKFRRHSEIDIHTRARSPARTSATNSPGAS